VKSAFTFSALIFIVHLQIAVAQRVSLFLPETQKNIVINFEPASGARDNFRSIRIDSDGRRFRFAPKAPVARIPTRPEERLQRGLLWDKIFGLQLHSSRYFFHGEYSMDSKTHTLLFFISEGGASDAAPLLVIGFSADGRPYKVLEREEFDPTSFQPTDRGDAFIIGKATMSQGMGGDDSNGSKTPYATTYDPFSVFVIHNLSRAEYSLIESRKYNQEHYVWAGPRSREDYAVLYNLPGHRKLVGAPASRVAALLGANRIPVQ
jgi:hypothetical protein